MLLHWSKMDNHTLGIWLTWGCKGLVFWSLRDTDHRSDGKMLPDQQLITALLSVCASALLLKSLLSSEKSKRNIKDTLIDILNSSGFSLWLQASNFKFTFLGLQSVSVPRCANTPRSVKVISCSSLSPISVTTEPRASTWSAFSSLTGLKDWIGWRTRICFNHDIRT